MFVRKSTYDSCYSDLMSLRISFEVLKRRHEELAKNWNDLVRKINHKGGESFLDQEPIFGCQFNEYDLKQILILCHPDKHNNSEKSNIITKKINEIRSNM